MKRKVVLCMFVVAMLVFAVSSNVIQHKNAEFIPPEPLGVVSTSL